MPRGTLLLALCVGVYLSAAVLASGLDREPWGDEGHFLETVRAFGGAPSARILLDYPEVTPPLAFCAYALWGRVFGFETAVLRVFSLLVAAAALIAFGCLFLRVLRRPLSVVAAMGALLLNPYTMGLSLFVYTDMLMMLALAVLLLGAERMNLWLLFTGAAAGLLTRQYFLFAVLGGAVSMLLRFRAGEKRALPATVALVAGCLPLAALMALWGGVAPPSGMERWMPSAHSLCQPGAWSLYAGLAAVFGLPIVAAAWRRFVFRPGEHGGILLASFVYFLIPVRASPVTLEQTGRETVGLFHRALAAALPSGAAVEGVFYLCFLAGLHVLYRMGKDSALWVRGRKASLSLLAGLMTGAFFLLMPFSYQVWEKYALPLVPLLALALCAEPAEGKREGEGAPRAGERG
ncbi:MAG: hypothetical protein WB626_06060 [Bacteroidota bacterium]